MVIAVVGAGVMGLDLAATMAFYGHDVILKDIDSEVLEKAPRTIAKNIRNYRLVSASLSNWDTEDILQNITFTDTYHGFEDADWIIENIIEDWGAKKTLYQELADIGKANTLYAANTSCFSITELSSLLNWPENLIGIHFMNPVPIKRVVETIRGFHTSAETIKETEILLKSISKSVILVEDSPGFVSNRLSHLYMNEAAFLVQENVAEPKKIDVIMKKCYNHKMGPLETADLIGLDTVVRSLNVLYQNYQDPKFRCCPLLKKMVAAGLLGRKSGEGFYKY